VHFQMHVFMHKSELDPSLSSLTCLIEGYISDLLKALLGQ